MLVVRGGSVASLVAPTDVALAADTDTRCNYRQEERPGCDLSAAAKYRSGVAPANVRSELPALLGLLARLAILMPRGDTEAIEAGEVLDLVLAAVAHKATPKRCQWQNVA